MVKVEIIRSVSNGEIISYVSEGLANYDKYGKDIVCAGVSAVTFGTVNSIEAFLEIVPEHTIYEGFLKVVIPERIEPKTFEQVHLLESMAVILKSIQGSYGEFLTIKELYNSFIDFTGGRHVVFHFSNISLFNDVLEN